MRHQKILAFSRRRPAAIRSRPSRCQRRTSRPGSSSRSAAQSMSRIARAAERGDLNDANELGAVEQVAPRPTDGGFHVRDLDRGRQQPCPVPRALELLAQVLFHLLLGEQILPAVEIRRPGVAEDAGTVARRQQPQRAQRLDQALADMRAVPGRRDVVRWRPTVRERMPLGGRNQSSDDAPIVRSIQSSRVCRDA